MSGNGHTSPTKMPRTIEDVRQRLLESIPTYLGEYRVFEGRELESPMPVAPPPPDFERLREVYYEKLCETTRTYSTFFDDCFDMMETLAASDEHSNRFREEETQAAEASHEKLLEMEDDLIAFDLLHNPFGIRTVRQEALPTYIVALKQPYGVLQFPSKTQDSAAWDAFHRNFKFPDAYLKAVPFPSHLNAEELRLQGLGNLGITPRVFWRRMPGGPVERKNLNSIQDEDNYHIFAANDDCKSSNQDQSAVESFEANDEETTVQITDDELEILPLVEEPSSDEEFQNYEFDGEYSDVETSKQQASTPQTLQEYFEASDDSSSNHDSTSDDDFSSDDDEEEVILKAQLAERERQKRIDFARNHYAPHPNHINSRQHNNDRYDADRELGSRQIYANKTPRRSDSILLIDTSESESESEGNQSDFQPIVSKKRKISEPQPKAKPNTKAPVQSKRSKVHSSPSQDSDSEDENLAPPAPKRARKSPPKTKPSSNSKDDEDLKPFSPKRAGKSLPESKTSSQPYGDENIDASRPRQGRKTLPRPSVSSQSADDFTAQVEEEDTYTASPARKGRQTLPKPVASSQLDDDFAASVEEEDLYTALPSRKGRKILPKSTTSAQSGNDLDSDLNDGDDDYKPSPRKRARKSLPEPKIPLRHSSHGVPDNDDDDMPPPKRARKSLPEPKVPPKHDSNGFDSDSDNDDKQPPEGARKSVPKTKNISQYGSNDSDFDAFHDSSTQYDSYSDHEADYESESAPPKKTQHKTKPKTSNSDGEPLLPGKWTQREHDAAEAIIRGRRAAEASDLSLDRLRDERLFRYVSHRLSLVGVHRTHGPCKNYWNRYGRTRSGFEERYGKEAGANLVTSAQKPKGTAKPRVKKNQKDPKPKPKRK